jgi:hypothetical protein
VNRRLIHAVSRSAGVLARAVTTEEAVVVTRLLGLGAAASLLVVSVAGSAGAATGSIWQVVPSVNPQAGQVTDSSFASVSMASTSDGWAVGTFSDSGALSHPLTEHWNGTGWSRVFAPEPSGTQARMAGVDELSSGNAWAVGNTAADVVGENNIDNEPLIEHWNGTKWSIVHGASLPAGSTGILDAISGSGPDDLWAVGYQLTTGDAQESVLFEHFNGTTWQVAAFPTQESACDPNASDCFLQPTAVSDTAAGNVWVVGTVREPNPTANFIARWNGTAWSVVPAPCLTGKTIEASCSLASEDLNELSGVTTISPTDAWASGSEGNVNDENFNIPYVLHWNGTAWSLVTTPNLGGEGSLLNGITALSSGDIWAVGQTQALNGAIRTLTEQFNGSTWNLVPSPSPGASGRIPDDSLSGVASPGGAAVFAVGARDIPGECCLRTLGLTTTSG